MQSSVCSWQQYNLDGALANQRDFGFKDQITRSGLSIPSNIAEGMDRFSVNDKTYFLHIAKGSCAELRAQIYIAMDVGYIPNNIGKEWISETEEISAMQIGLIRSLHPANS